MPRWLWLALLGALTAGCTLHTLVRPLVIDEYQNALVRVYRNGSQCRIEVTTATETVQTFPTHCWITPIVARGTP